MWWNFQDETFAFSASLRFNGSGFMEKVSIAIGKAFVLLHFSSNYLICYVCLSFRYSFGLVFNILSNPTSVRPPFWRNCKRFAKRMQIEWKVQKCMMGFWTRSYQFFQWSRKWNWILWHPIEQRFDDWVDVLSPSLSFSLFLLSA